MKYKMKRFQFLRIRNNCLNYTGITALCCLLSISPYVRASAFQLWEQDALSVGNYHAGYAALANDASIAWYNPAGITRFTNQQLVLAANSVLTSFKYQGDVTVGTINGGRTPIPTTAQGGNYALIPAVHYVAPITDWLGFGFSADIPFGLKIDYGRTSALQYATTQASLTVVDLSPSLGIQITKQASIGFGLDFQKMYAEFDSVGVLMSPITDTLSTNRASGSAYGYHLGAMYQFTPCTRVGLSYHSQVVHHLSGPSRFEGFLADRVAGGTIASHSSTHVTLPPYTALSAYHRFHPQVAIMGSLIFTQWTTVQSLIINSVSGIFQLEPSKSILVDIPQSFRNTWNASIGADYYVSEQMTLRGGIGYDETPVREALRSVQLPDNNRYVLALGGHYQVNCALGVDVGWTHFFFKQARVTPPPQFLGDQEVRLSGHVNGGADVYGVQLSWDMV